MSGLKSRGLLANATRRLASSRASNAIAAPRLLSSALAGMTTKRTPRTLTLRSAGPAAAGGDNVEFDGLCASHTRLSTPEAVHAIAAPSTSTRRFPATLKPASAASDASFALYDTGCPRLAWTAWLRNRRSKARRMLRRCYRT